MPTAPTYTEADHLEGKDASVRRTYERLIAAVSKFGPLRIEPKKTSIHLAARFGFAGVYTRKSCINLELHLARKLASKRVAKVEQASANRFHHTIKLAAPEGIDNELIAWLREAYELKK